MHLIMKKGIFFQIILLFLFALTINFYQTFAEEAMEYKVMGDRYFYIKDYAKALEFYQKALSLNKEYPEVFLKIGTIYKIQGLFDVAYFYYKEADKYKDKFQIKEHIDLLLYELAELSFYKSEFPQFKSNLETIIKKDQNYKYLKSTMLKIVNLVVYDYSKYGKAYYQIGYHYFFSGYYEFALNYFVFSRVYQYKEAESYWFISKIFYNLGNKENYIKYQNLAYSLNKSFAKFDSSIRWKTTPYDKSFLIAYEKKINEFNGHYYLAPKSK